MKKFLNARNRIVTAALLLPVTLGTLASAQTTGATSALASSGFNIDDAKVGLAAILTVGVGIVVGMTVFRVGKRGAGMV